MRTTVGSSRRVGVWAARNRATPTRTRRRLRRALRPGQRLADAGLVHLEPVEAGVLGQQGVAEGGDRGRARAAAAQVAGHDGAGPVDAALDVPAPRRARRGRRPRPRAAGPRARSGTGRGRRAGRRGRTPRNSSGDGWRTSAWWRPLAVVKEWWTVSQSPWSFWMWKRVMRRAAAKATARPSCSGVAPAAAAPRIASTTASGSSSRQRPAEGADVAERRPGALVGRGEERAAWPGRRAPTRSMGWRHSERLLGPIGPARLAPRGR